MRWVVAIVVAASGAFSPQEAASTNDCMQDARSEMVVEQLSAMQGQSLLQSAFSADVKWNKDVKANATEMNLSFDSIGAGIVRSVSTERALRTRTLPPSFCVFLLFLPIAIVLVFQCYMGEKAPNDELTQEFIASNEKGKVYSYNNDRLVTWGIFLSKTPAIVFQWRVWIVVPCILCTAYSFALLVLFEVPQAQLLDTTSLDEFTKYLRVFIAFMLGLFLNNSFGRWQSSVSNFRQLLTSVKQLMWVARLMNFSEDLTAELERLCLLACYILDAELRTDLGCKTIAWKEHWHTTFLALEEKGLLKKEEEEAFRQERAGHCDIDMGRYSTMVWAWIGQHISEMKAQPGVLVPMYIRLVCTCAAAQEKVDKLKTCVQVQVPFTYSYLLSMIVHLNNIILAVCGGLVIGSALSELHTDDSLSTAKNDRGHTHKMYESCALLVEETTILLIQPMMYQACLVIAQVLNHPFGENIYHLPTETFIEMLRDELMILGDSFAKKPPDSKQEHKADHSDDVDSAGDGDDGDDCDD